MYVLYYLPRKETKNPNILRSCMRKKNKIEHFRTNQRKEFALISIIQRIRKTLHRLVVIYSMFV